MKKILITGVTGFIGKNLISRIEQCNDYIVLPYTRKTSDDTLSEYIEHADIVIHLAGVSRPKDSKEFYTGNSDLTKKIVDLLIEKKRLIPFIYTSSIHAMLDNDFGKSKRLAEGHILSYAKEMGAHVHIIRLTNTFGKWAKPNAHSVIATFCHNVANNIDITISDPLKVMELVYIDDLIESIIQLIEKGSDANLQQKETPYLTLTKTYTKSLSEIASAISEFKQGKQSDNQKQDDFLKKLYTTYLSYVH